ncbi:MAG: amino acid adenylation domain-containing protein [Bacteroidota bacterium]
MAKADMWWHAMDAGNIVGFSVIYSTDLFDQKDMMRFADHYKQLVAGLVRSVNLPIDQLPYLTEAQLQTVLNFGRNEQLFQDQTFITKLFEQQAEKYPEAIALTVEDRSYSYRELNKKVNQLTHVLREKYNIKPGDVVGVIVNRSEWIAISLLAVLKTGAVYLPGDPDNPHERLAYMLQNAKAKALVSQSELLIEIMEFFHSTLVLVDMELSYDEGNFSNPEILVTEQDPAYVIYTSGTSGEPKGVQVSHGSLANLLTGLRQTLNYGEAQHFALMASMSFDASLKQILQPLLLGKHLVIVDQIRNIRKAAATLAEQKVNVLSITPTVLQAVVSELSLRKLPNTFRLICCGGELLDPTFSNQLLDHFPDATLTNIYGPTETTDLAATFAIHSTHEDVVPVGKPLPNCEIFILDEVKQPVPIGNKGEIFIGGKGVSLGYIHDPERTNQKFVTHPFDITKKIYKTGDIGYFGEDGNLRIIGRADDQVKVRGHRIELGEIKNRLIKHPHVQQCAITCIGEGVDKEIVAYVVEKDIVTVRPSWAEQFVYDDMAYYAMGSDQYRNDKYREALSKVVKDKVVLEIGPGSDAVLSLMAIECGAGKVYAVEVLEESYRKAKKKVEMLGWTNRIEVIHGDVTTITLPEKVDCCIADIVGSIGGSQGSATILNASRRLMNAEPKVVPARSISRIAAATLPPENFDYSFDEIGAHYARKIFERVGYTYDIRLSLDNFKLQYLLSTADVFEDLDYRIENNLNDKHEISLEITSPGICHGFIVWLDLFFDDDIKVDTLTDKAQKLWLPIYLPVFPEGAPVTRGDMIKASVSKKLSKNGLHPDYGIEGHLIKDKQQLPFRFDSFNEEKVFKNNVFYERLFETSTQNGNEAMPEAKGLKVYKSLDHQAVIRYLGDHLPHYMLPTHVIKVSGIPTTVNGKVNFKALPAPEERIVDLRNPADRSLDPVEEKLLNIWKDVLRRESIMPDDSFFSIGGHSLRAAQLIARIHMEFKIEFDLKDVFDHPTIGEMAIKIKSMKSRDIEHILPVEEQDHYRVSHAQKRLWLLQQADKNLTAYNNPIALELSGVFDIDAFGKAYQMLLSRHEIMRSVFITVAAEPRQKIHQPEKKIYEVEWIDYTDGKHRTADIDKVVRAFTDTPFDLSNGPLAKTAVIKLSENRFVWLFSMHHIISDAWSLGVLMDELLTYYKTYANGLEPETRSLRIQYKDFTAWQYNQLQSRAELKSYWAQQFEEIPEQLSLPTDFSRTRSITFAGDHVTVDLDVQVSAGLRQYTTDRGSSLFITLTSAVATLLYKYTGQTDIIVGTNVAGRDHQDLENQIGFYLNTLPIRIRIDENAAFSSLHDRVKRETFDAFAHQLYPYDQLISDLSTRGLDTSQPLFNVEVELIHVNMGNQSDVELSGVKTRRYENNFSISKDDLSFRFIENDAKLTLSIGYKTDLFEKETIERMMQRFVQVVSAILENDSIPLAEINYLTEAERQQMTIALDAQG